MFPALNRRLPVISNACTHTQQGATVSNEGVLQLEGKGLRFPMPAAICPAEVTLSEKPNVSLLCDAAKMMHLTLMLQMLR